MTATATAAPPSTGQRSTSTIASAPLSTCRNANANGPTPISTMDSTSIPLRPTRSPKWPQTIPPRGRAMKPAARVANAARVPAVELNSGKYSCPNTAAEAMPKR